MTNAQEARGPTIVPLTLNKTCPGWNVFVTRSWSDVYRKQCRRSFVSGACFVILRITIGRSRAKRSTELSSSLQAVTFGGNAQISGAAKAHTGYSGGIE